ncbi:hypothetical protein BCR37DRAFT_172537 [Protomyces lactucae-debilis]|uniref:Uncharacterized protein n=1 Tax=Protomyces lactucae-debilis TaxID=2754530 RepID=A0A1Y2EWC0_PROLT|nr:uncharacterized protein BCR37DRAFT_172537 [Protomyces lactucae-debilis]ORY75797.1 hypothetical protein BCR37DRAFT_172537 [Protomyces lactucae-debilis]
MSGISRNGAGLRRSRKAPITQEEVFTYALRTTCMAHHQRTRSRWQVSKQRPDAAVEARKASRTSLSIADILGGASKDKKTLKFPKELVKLLDVALKKVWMRQDPEYEDVLIRGTFGFFYSYYTTEAFQKQLRDNRRIEDLILMFFSKATQELQKRMSDEEAKNLVNIHVAKFIRLITQVIRSNHLERKDSEIVLRLNGYEQKLLQNNDYISLVSEPPSAPATPVPWLLNEMVAVHKLGAAFRKSSNALDLLIDQQRSMCTDLALLRDLKTQVEHINMQSNKEFDSEEAFNNWKQSEIKELTQAILKLTSGNTTLAKVSDGRMPGSPSRSRASSFTSEDLSKRMSQVSLQEEEPHPYFFIPPDPFNHYRELLSVLLEDDLAEAASRVQAGDDDARFDLLSKLSLEVLQDCRVRWRISPGGHAAIYLDVCKSLFVAGRLDIELLDEILVEMRSESPTTWTRSERESYKRSMLSLNDHLIRELYSQLEKAFFKNVDTKALYILQEHIYTDLLFQEAAPETAHLFDEMEDGLRNVAVDAYRSQLAKIRKGTEIEVLHVVKLAVALVKDLSRLQRKYQQPILDIIDLPGIYQSVALPLFLGDFKGLVEECYRCAKSQDRQLAMEDMFELYRATYQVIDFVGLDKSPIDLDQYFRPYVLQWLQGAHKSITELVPAAIAKDEFTVDTESNDEGVRSHSIIMLFRSFNQHLTFLKDLEWPEEYWHAKFITALSKSFSDAIREYCISVERLFWIDVNQAPTQAATPTVEAATLQQRLMAKAREAMTTKVLEPFHISSAACVKLNNIEWAKLQLDKMERSIDTEALAATIEKYEGPVVAWKPGQRTIFTIKVMAAEGLKACDTNGFSDPYVVLSGQKGNRIGKTRVVPATLSPRWDESFDVPTTEPLWVCCTVWDQDPSGDHDICGRCYFKLDPRFFEDFQPKEFHVNLDTQGVLHLKVTMEGDCDDSAFYFGRAFRSLSRAESDMTRSIVDKMTPFIDASLSPNALKNLLSRPLNIDNTLDSAYSLLNKAGFNASRSISVKRESLTNADMEGPIEPLMAYLDNNFRVLDESLSRPAFLLVMTKLWNFTLTTIEDLIVPPLHSTSIKAKKPLSERELDVVYKWLGFLKETFHGDGGGLSEEELQTPLYHEILSLRFFYFDPVEELIEACERTIQHTRQKQEALLERKRTQYAASTGGNKASLMERQRTRAAASEYRNLGTIRKKREEKIRERRELSNAEDVILRVLKLRSMGSTVMSQVAPVDRQATLAKDFVKRRIKEKQEASRLAEQQGIVRPALNGSRKSSQQSTRG